jgi:thioredoxin reductase (NADPH)
VGSDDEAANDAFFLTGIAKKVTMITSNKEMEMSYAWRKKLEERNGFEIMLNSKVKAIEGNGIVEAVNVLNLKTGKEKRFQTNAVFISVGSVPMTDITYKAGVDVDENGCIKVDHRQRTNVEGVFAAGNCTCGGTQIVTAVGEGAKAAIEASIHVKSTMKNMGDKTNKKKNS